MVPRNAGSVSSGVGHSAKIRVFISCSFSFGIKTPFDILPEPIMNNIHSAENRVTILGRLGIYFTPTLVISPFGGFSPWFCCALIICLLLLGIYVDWNMVGVQST